MLLGNVGTLQVRTAEVGIAQVSTAEVGTAEIGIGETGTPLPQVGTSLLVCSGRLLNFFSSTSYLLILNNPYVNIKAATDETVMN